MREHPDPERSDADFAGQAVVGEDIIALPDADEWGGVDYFVWQAVRVFEHRKLFMRAGQRKHETLLAWHSRLRHFFLRAYPETAAATTEEIFPLILQFVAGLGNPAVRANTCRMAPMTYAEALHCAKDSETDFYRTQRLGHPERTLFPLPLYLPLRLSGDDGDDGDGVDGGVDGEVGF
jgi:hypothetical protein